MKPMTDPKLTGTFVKLTELLERYFDLPSRALPKMLAELVAQEFSFDDVSLWDMLSPAQRRRAAADRDFAKDPALAPVHDAAWVRNQKADALREKIRHLESLPALTIGEYERKQDMIRAHRAQLSGLDQSEAVEPDPTEANAAKVWPMSRAALVSTHKHHWPTVDSDLRNASKNGLGSAKAGPRNWDESRALEWARARGKLLGERPGVRLDQWPREV